MSTKVRSILLRILLCSVLAVAVGTSASAAAKPSRAVSLNALVAAIKSGSQTDQAKTLCGITRLRGYLPDADSKDIVLLGIVDPDLPPLHLEDLVVAMRNVWGGYNRVSGHIQYYADPGCSIDPNPAVIAQLRDFQATHPTPTTLEALNARTEDWKKIGSQPQKVRVLGVPFDCRFAKVMVDADYYMKRIVNGSVDLGIDGLHSLSDLDIEATRQQMRAGKSSTGEGGSLSRFWFSPGDSTYEVRGGATLLQTCEVKLLTEKEYLNELGVIADMGRPDPAADLFARGFSEKYDQIAAQRPIYKELKALFGFVAIARLMKDDHMQRTAGSSIAYLLQSYKVPNVPVSRAVNGLTQVRPIDETVDTPRGTARLNVLQSSCGGVSMSVRPRRIKTVKPYVPAAAVPIAAAPATAASKSAPTVFASHTTTKPAKPKASQAKSIKRAVLGSRKSPTAMSWDVPVQLD